MRHKVKAWIAQFKKHQAKRKTRASDKRTFTKRAVKWLLLLGCINGTLPYILAFFDKEPVTEIGIAWITEIVAVIAGYLLKSYFETKQARKQDLDDFKVVNSLEDECEGDSENEDE